MSASEIIQIVTNVGFPVLCCFGLAWWVRYTTDKEREEREKLTEKHKEEMHEITEQHRNEIKEVVAAINNNTFALQKLCDKLDG